MAIGRIPEPGTGIPESIIAAKGDLIVGTANDAPGILSVGTDGHTLVADSVETTGLKWVAPAVASSSFTFISRTSFSDVASQAFDDVFTSTYQKYYVALDNMAAATNANDLHLQFRYAGPTTQTATYFGFSNHFSSAEATTFSNNSSEFFVAPNTGDTGDYRSGGYFYFTNVGNSSQPALVLTSYADASNPTFAYGGGQNNTARIYTGFLLKASASNITGTVTIYGLANS